MKAGRGKWLQYGLTAVVVLGIVWAGFQYLSGEELLAALREFNYLLVAPMLLVSAGSLLVKAWRFVVLARPVTDARWGLLVRAYLAGRPATLLPGGVAARAGFLKQAGVDGGTGASPVLFDSLLDQAFLLPASVVIAFWFPQARLPLMIALGVLVVVGGALLIPAARRPISRLLDGLASRFKLRDTWHAFLESSQALFTVRTMLYAYALTVVSYLLMVGVLVLALWGLGLDVALHKTLMAVILSNLVGRLLPIPGGIGVTEASLVGFLVVTAGVGENAGTAATALYRIATLLWQALLGAAVYFFAWRGSKEEAEPADQEQNTEPAVKPAKSLLGS